jgi:hypothetical protein
MLQSVARSREIRCIQDFLFVGKLQREGVPVIIDVDNIKTDLREIRENVQTGFNWPRIGTVGLLMRKRNVDVRS